MSKISCNTVNNPISIFMGCNNGNRYKVLKEYINSKKGIKLFGNGKTLVNPDDIVNMQTKTAILWAHGQRYFYKGNIVHIQSLFEYEKNDYSVNQTIKNIMYIQEKTGATDFYILSCYARSAISSIRQSYGDLLPNTSIIMIGSSMGTARSNKNLEIIQFILNQLDAGEDVLVENIFTEIALLYPQTITLCKITKDPQFIKGKQLLEIKYSLPKKREDISDIKSYLSGPKSLSGSKELVDLVKPLLVRKAEKLTCEQIRLYRDCALLIFFNLRKYKPFTDTYRVIYDMQIDKTKPLKIENKTQYIIFSDFITTQLLDALKKNNPLIYVAELMQRQQETNKNLYINQLNSDGNAEHYISLLSKVLLT